MAQIILTQADDMADQIIEIHSGPPRALFMSEHEQVSHNSGGPAGLIEYFPQFPGVVSIPFHTLEQQLGIPQHCVSGL
jgi:hypothetical protein